MQVVLAMLERTTENLAFYNFPRAPVHLSIIDEFVKIVANDIIKPAVGGTHCPFRI